ncbi:hypothetical protein PAECIP111893_02993 [Paenibacillus plantiphilus]|uniref:ABC-2 type transport system permease protein n=1 Tax=Paenibacillus plantiphilus TaxID=2905650 RepID=A0ABN8GH57_9BACL|nr:ABC transporter permease [Paenibacillus plantiphilus]CAH1209150.1 hypothetical protein PAECIP111893_02993 [Paenibacillus plantiphilus]
MDNLLKSELFKLRKNRTFWTLIIIILSLAASFVVLTYIDIRMNGEQQVTGLDYLTETFSGNNYMIKLALSILAGLFMASEYMNGVMKTIASSGNSRVRIYSAKLLVISFAAIVISLVFPATMLTLGTLLSGFGELPGISSVEYLLRSAGLTFLYAMAFASIVAFFSTVFSDSGQTIGVSLIFFLFIDTVLYTLGSYFPIIETLDNYFVFKLSMEIGELNIANDVLFKLAAVPIITYMLFGLLGAWIFSRKEIK